MARIIISDSGRFVLDGRQVFDALIDDVAHAKERNLLLYVHGGLVDENEGKREAEDLDALFSQLEPHWHSGYLVWRSGLFEVLGLSQPRLQRNPMFRRLVERTIDLTGRHALIHPGAAVRSGAEPLETLMARLDGEPTVDPAALEARIGADETRRAHAIDDLPEQAVTDTPIYRDLAADPELAALIAAQQDDRGGEADMLDASIWREVDGRVIGTPGDRAALESALGLSVLYHAARAAYRVIKRLLTRRDHGLGPTIVEEVARELYLAAIGAFVWNTMKDDMRAHFDNGAPGTLLLDRIADMATADTSRKVRLLVLTHSAGSVFGVHLAHHARRLPANVSVELIFLAPAIRLDEATRLLIDQPARFADTRMFALTDRFEQDDHLYNSPFGALYHRSLLYLVSGVFEWTDRGAYYPDAPIAGMERHFGPNPHHDKAEAAFDQRFRALFAGHVPDRIAQPPSVGNPPGHQTDAHYHGGFWGDPQTKTSVVEVMLHGFT